MQVVELILVEQFTQMLPSWGQDWLLEPGQHLLLCGLVGKYAETLQLIYHTCIMRANLGHTSFETNPFKYV